MSQIRAICQATIDHPHADGIVRDGGFGLLHQFRFRDEFPTRPEDLRARPEPEWDYSADGEYNVEAIPELSAVAPRGMCDCEDMTLYDPQTDGLWQPTNSPGAPNCSNLWKEAYPVGHPRAKHLFFYDARGAYDAEVGYFGEVTSRFDFHADPNFTLRALRYAPAPDLPQDRYCYLEVQLLGDSETGQWALVLPMAGTRAEGRFPRLGWRLTPADDWEVLAEFPIDAHATAALHRWSLQQAVTWETVDGHLVLNLDGRRVVYYVPPDRRVPEGAFIAGGPARVVVYGHAAMINLTQIKYPLGDVVPCHVDRRVYFPVANTVFTGTAQCRSLAWEPEGTTAEASARKTVEGAEDHYVPRIQFTSPHNYRRAVAYLHLLDLPPVVSAGVSSPYVTQGANVLAAARGELTSSWRNAECRVTLDLERSAVANLPEWKGNNKVTVAAGWDLGSSQDTATQFTGYLVGAAHQRQGGRPERVEIDLHARDGFARLERKRWQHLACVVEWRLEEVFHRVLQQCGIPDSHIEFTGDHDLRLPAGARRMDLRFDFGADTPVTEGLNRIVAACGYVWGVDPSGTWFCRPPAAYTGTPDFVLDDDTAAAADVAFALRAEALREIRPCGRGFVNSVFVRIDRGGEPDEAWRRDAESHQSESAEDFIGDDWWHVFVGYDEQSASTLAERLLEERGRRERMLHFRCSGKPHLFPDDFVQVQATGVRVPTDAVFQVTRKAWRATSDGEFVTEFDCCRVTA